MPADARDEPRAGVRLMDTATAAETFKRALYTAAKDVVFAGQANTLVCYGHPGANAKGFRDWVVFLDTEAEQDVATLAGPSRRTRDETLTQVVVLSAFLPGDGEELEIQASDRAYTMLRALERHVRITDTTLGGAVEWCFLTRHRSSGETDPDLVIDGREIQIEATFTALARVRG